MNGEKERRGGVFYKQMFWRVLGATALLFVTSAVAGYMQLSTDKADKSSVESNRNRIKELSKDIKDLREGDTQYQKSQKQKIDRIIEILLQRKNENRADEERRRIR